MFGKTMRRLDKVLDQGREQLLETRATVVEKADELTAKVPTIEIEIMDRKIELKPTAIREGIYNAVVPQCAQAVTRGEMPTKIDASRDVMAFVGGPLEGCYVAVTSESASLIREGQIPTKEQLIRDIISAVTPVIMRKFGL